MKDDIEIIKDQMVDLSELFSQYTRHKTGTIASKQNGFLVLFCGESGTEKTLAANMLEKITEKKILRIDLSRVISKYIGETEKNLSTIFEKAKQNDFILFFDEADALFGKRTKTKDSHDRYANQEISYLLKLFNNYPGIVIISFTNKHLIDIRTKRKFRAIIDF